METIVIIEILDSSGLCKERHQLSQFPAVIGRSYSSDIYISDVYVCPSHFEISITEQGAIAVRDLNSVNGLFLASKKRKVLNHEVDKNVELRIGQTVFRIIDARVQVPATVLFDRPGLWSRRIRFSWKHALLSLILFLALYFIDGYVLNLRNGENQKFEVLVAGFVGSLMAFLPWAAIWSLVGKVNINKPRFFAHFSIPLIISLFYWSLRRAYGYVEYAFGQPTLLEWFAWIFSFLAFTMIFYYHLLYSSKMPERRRWFYSAIVSLLLITVSVLVELKNEFSFTSKLPLSYLVKAPWARIVTATGVSEYTDKLTKLKDKF